MENKPRVFLDTSVWIAGALSDSGASSSIIEAGLAGDIEIVSSTDVFEEAVRNLKKKYPDKLELFLETFGVIKPLLIKPSKLTISKASKLVDIKDAPILAAAIGAGTDIFVTLDKKHFLNILGLSSKTGIKILNPGDSLRHIR